jgi:DNA-binding response OmpR family regulator
MKTTDDASAAVVLQETVLVVDDEVLVRMVIAGYLRDCGYRVIEAASAEEARLVIEKDEEGAVNVVLSGVATGGDQGGFALAQWIRARRPGCQVVLAASPAREAQAAGEICERGPMLGKPYEPRLVLERIRRLMARRPRQA